MQDLVDPRAPDPGDHVLVTQQRVQRPRVVVQQLEQRLSQEREFWRCHVVDLIAAEREQLGALVEKKHAKVIELLKVDHKEIFDWVQRVLEQSTRQALVGFDRLEAKVGQVVPMRRPDDDDGEPPPSTH